MYANGSGGATGALRAASSAAVNVGAGGGGGGGGAMYQECCANRDCAEPSADTRCASKYSVCAGSSLLATVLMACASRVVPEVWVFFAASTVCTSLGPTNT